MTASLPAPARGARLASVDALRGITVAAMLLVNTPGDWGHVYAPLQHAQWHGCTPTDLVFPFFLCIVGVSIALGVVPRAQAGTGRAVLMHAVVVRGLRIAGLGLLLHLLAWWWLDLPHYRPWGVLQRIGLCFVAAGAVALYLRPRAQWLLLAALLAGWWALLLAGGTLAPFDNIASRIDDALLGPWLYQHDPLTGRGHDPEGLPSTLGALATTMLGLRAGDWLRAGQRRRLWAAAALALVLGLACTPWMPWNKQLWTPSYVLWTGGWALLAVAAAHALVDRRGWPALGRAFGVNAIAAYAGSAVMVYALAGLGLWEPLYRHLFAGWMTPRFGPALPSLAFALAFVGLWWLAMRWMDRRGWHLKV